jgi:hypothetical protein
MKLKSLNKLKINRKPATEMVDDPAKTPMFKVDDEYDDNSRVVQIDPGKSYKIMSEGRDLKKAMEAYAQNERYIKHQGGEEFINEVRKIKPIRQIRDNLRKSLKEPGLQIEFLKNVRKKKYPGDYK